MSRAVIHHHAVYNFFFYISHPRSRSRSLLVGVTARGVSSASYRSVMSGETGKAYGVGEHRLGRWWGGGAIWFDMVIGKLPCTLPYKKASVPALQGNTVRQGAAW